MEPNIGSIRSKTRIPKIIDTMRLESRMELKAAQQDVQSTFVGGSVGQTVSGVIWLLSARMDPSSSAHSVLSHLPSKTKP